MTRNLLGMQLYYPHRYVFKQAPSHLVLASGWLNFFSLQFICSIVPMCQCDPMNVCKVHSDALLCDNLQASPKMFGHRFL